MQGYLRQSTASQTRTIGPFIDSGDFVSLENGLTIANTDILLKKNGGASAAKNSGGATADGAGGKYAVTFDATDTNTVGELDVTVTVAGALTYFTKFTVLEEAIYDAMFAGSANAFTGAAGSTKVTNVALVDTLTTYTGNTPQTSDKPTIAQILAAFGGISGAVEDDAGNSSTVFQSNLAETADDYYNGGSLVFTSGTNIGQVRRITDYVGSTGTITVSPAFDAEPDAADAFVIIGRIE